MVRVRNYLLLEHAKLENRSKYSVCKAFFVLFKSIIFKHIQNLTQLCHFQNSRQIKNVVNILWHFAKISNGYN